jgi:hypothetical protein
MNAGAIVFDSRYCGPRGFVNGGYAAGVLARAIDGPAEVMLKAPVPFATPVALSATEQGFAAHAGGAEIASLAPARVDADLPTLPGEAEIDAARTRFLADQGMTVLYPYCFVCGKKREAGDGLRIFAGPANATVNADYWTPDESLAEDSLVRPEFLWAALDCPSAFALRIEGRAVLLGKFAVEIKRRPAPGERLLVAAWTTGGERRKHYSSSALLDEGRTVIAQANALWIEPADAALLARLKTENI